MNKKIDADYYGKLMKILLCCIIWYKEVIHGKFFRGPNIFLILGILLTMVVFLDFLSRRERTIRIHKISWRYLMYLIFTFLIGFISSQRLSDHISNGITVIEFAFIMLYVCYYASTRGDIEFLVWNFAVVYIFMTILFIFNPARMIIGGMVRYSYSVDTNPNSFAKSMTTGIWAILYLIAQRKIKLLFGMPICGVMLYAIFMTGSKKGLIAALICFAFWFLFYYIPINEKGSLSNKMGKVVVSIIVISVMIFILLPYFNDSVVATRFSSFLSDKSTTERINMYFSGFEYLKHSPIFGYGYWGFAYYYSIYSHSTWIEAFVSSGFILGMFFISIYISIARQFIRLYKKRNIQQQNGIIISQYLILFISLLFYSVCIIHFYDLCVMICIGMIISSVSYNDNNLVYRGN